MRCDDPGCTGKHSNSVPIKERCPAAIARKNEWSQRRYYSDHGPTRRQIQRYRFNYDIKRRRARMEHKRAEAANSGEPSLFSPDLKSTLRRMLAESIMPAVMKTLEEETWGEPTKR
jgi:hypothetical protein